MFPLAKFILNIWILFIYSDAISNSLIKINNILSKDGNINVKIDNGNIIILTCGIAIILKIILIKFIW